jgi:hypothetical protein
MEEPMLKHIIYIEALSRVNREFCATLPRDEVKRRLSQLIEDISFEKGLELPEWEHQVLATQLVHDVPNKERLSA